MVESRALLKLRAPKGLRGFESLPHRFITQCRVVKLSVVHRLDGYEVEKPEIFERVIEFIRLDDAHYGSPRGLKDRRHQL